MTNPTEAPTAKQVELARRRLHEIGADIKRRNQGLVAERDPKTWMRYLKASADLYRLLNLPLAAERMDKAVAAMSLRVSAA